MRRRVPPGIILISLLTLHAPAWADRLEEIEKKLQIIMEHQKKLQAEQQELQQEIERLKAGQDSIGKGQAKKKLSEKELEGVAAGQAEGQAGPGQAEEPPQISLERALVERGGLLLPRGQLEIAPSLEYNFFDTRRISVSGFSILPTLVVGVLETEKVQRHFIDSLVTFRLGAFRDFQAEVRVPYRAVYNRRSTETTETTDHVSGIGDVEAAIFYQPVREWGWVPDVILGAGARFPTGDDPFGGTADVVPLGVGFYGATVSATAVKSSDPAAVFLTLLYTHNFSRTTRLLATDPFESEISPGNTFGYNAGVAVALNPELAVNFRVEQRFVSSTEITSRAPGSSTVSVPGSNLNVAIGFAGLTWALSRNVSMDLSFGIGLTEDSPDLSVRLTIPIRFELFD